MMWSRDIEKKYLVKLLADNISISLTDGLCRESIHCICRVLA